MNPTTTIAAASPWTETVSFEQPWVKPDPDRTHHDAYPVSAYRDKDKAGREYIAIKAGPPSGVVSGKPRGGALITDAAGTVLTVDHAVDFTSKREHPHFRCYFSPAGE